MPSPGPAFRRGASTDAEAGAPPPPPTRTRRRHRPERHGHRRDLVHHRGERRIELAEHRHRHRPQHARVDVDRPGETFVVDPELGGIEGDLDPFVEPGLSQQFQATSIPTMLIVKDGRVVDRIVGALPPNDLKMRLFPYLMKT